MSEQLAEGVYVSTQVGTAATREGPFNSFYLYGDAAAHKLVTRPLHEATDEIYEITHAAGRFEEGVMSNIRDYIVNLNRVTVRADNGYGRPVERFEPSSVAEAYIQRAYRTKSGEPIILLDTPVDNAGFALFVSYVMTNNELWPEDMAGETEDPRVDMIEKFRTQPMPIDAQPAVQQ